MIDLGFNADGLPLGHLPARGAAAHPTREALIVGDDRSDYQDLTERSWLVACSLVGLGIGPGDRVGLLMLNDRDLVAAFFGISMVGAVVVPINARYRSAEVAYLVADAELAAILTHDAAGDHVDFVGRLYEMAPDLPASDDPAALALADFPDLRSVVMLGSRDAAGLVGRERFDRLAGGDSEEKARLWYAGTALRDPAAIIYTSGTTARPRGVVLSHDAFVRGWMRAGRAAFGMTAEDRFWNPLPLFHVAALGPLTFTIGLGGTFVTEAFFDPGRALAQIEREAATILYPTYPPIMEALLGDPEYSQTDLGSVRCCLNVAPPETLKSYEERMPGVVQNTTYGQTEGGWVSGTRPDGDQASRLDTCGPPLPGTEVRIVDEAGADLPPLHEGEIVYRGFNAFSGYLNDSEKTAATIRDGWVFSGDAGVLDADGRLSFLGRIKEMMKVGGENVAPAEIEACLTSHPKVKLAQVISMPDDRLVEVPVAFVELVPEATLADGELAEHCAESLARFKLPRQIHVVDSWPMSATKIQKNKLKEQLESAVDVTSGSA